MSANYVNFEVLVKFDSDDRKVGHILPKLNTYPFKIKHIIEPRGRGYLDLHIFYNRLFSLVDEGSIVIGAMADDFEITQEGWDEIILSKMNVFPDQIFIIRTGSTVSSSIKHEQEQKLDLNFDIDSLENLYIVDEAPFWSRKLLDICGGLGPISFTDVWTLTLEYFLFHRCGINRTIFLERPIIHRRTKDEIDQQFATRWWTDRAVNFAFARSTFFKTLVEQQAVNIYGYIKMAEMSALPPQFVPKKSAYEPVVLTEAQLRAAKRVASYLKWKKAVLNTFPPFMRPSLIRLYDRTISSTPYLSKMKESLTKVYTNPEIPQQNSDDK